MDIVDRAKPRLRALRDRARKGSPSSQQQIRALRQRVTELEAEVIENRQLARRIAELTDVVEQLLLPGDGRELRLKAERPHADDSDDDEDGEDGDDDQGRAG